MQDAPGSQDYDKESEDFEEFEEEDVSESYVPSEATRSSTCSTYSPGTRAQYVGLRLDHASGHLKVPIPALAVLHLTAASLSVGNVSSKTHVVICNFEGRKFVVTRLIPDVIETQQLDIVIPARCREQHIEFVLHDTADCGSVDLVAMMYQEDSHEQGDTISPAAAGAESHSNDSMSSEDKRMQRSKRQQSKQNSGSFEGVFEQQAKAKLAEFKIEKSSGMTSIEYKDTRKGDGATAIQGKKVQIKFQITDPQSGKVLEQTPEGQNFAFRLGKNEVSRGIERIVLGMREGGVRDARGKFSEITEREGQGQVQVVITLVSVG